MKIKVSSEAVEKQKSGLIALPLEAKKIPLSTKELQRLDKKYNNLIKTKLKHFNFKAENNSRLELDLSDAKNNIYLKLYTISSLNKISNNHDDWRKLGGDVLQCAKKNSLSSITISLHSVSSSIIENVVTAITEGLILANYEFNKYKKKKGNKGSISIEILLPAKDKKNSIEKVSIASIYAKATSEARDLVNTAPSDLPPQKLLNYAKGIRGKGISLKFYNRKALTKLKAFALLGVARGSDAEPYLIHLSYKPATKNKNKKVITLIGKGITFDSGGLSIKPGKGMEDMKCDMAGAACVLTIAKAISYLPAKHKPKHEIHFLVPTCENMINGESLKPGDIISAINGKTIEVLNTDAEGRLILADALCYAERLKSNLIIDLATLTGACIVALGSDYSGMFSTTKEYGEKLKTTFAEAGEKLWELPIATEYRSQMNSTVADIKNIGDGGPGAIIGALFLKDFVPENTPWIHLDIAGPAFVTKSNEYIKKGGTGYGVLGLLRFLGE